MAWTKIIAAMLLAGIAVPAQAAPVGPTRNAAGKALILVPLTLTKIDDLDFGTIVTSGQQGIVSISPFTGARTLAGVTGVAADAGYRAYFGGGGSPNQIVIISLGMPPTLVNPTGDTLPMLALTLDGPPTRVINPTTRTFFFGVGGIVSIAPDQPDGVYSSTFDVTVDYQ